MGGRGVRLGEGGLKSCLQVDGPINGELITGGLGLG